MGSPRPAGALHPGRALTTPRLRSSARGAGAAQPPRAASASRSSGSGATRAQGGGGPGPQVARRRIALTGRTARRWQSPRPCAPRPRAPSPRQAACPTEPCAASQRRGGAC